MTDNEICTFELDYFQTKLGLAHSRLGETHKLLKNPSFSELNKMISDYPPSPRLVTESRSDSRKPRRGSSSSRIFERSPYTEEEHYKECTFKPKITILPGKENEKIPLAEKIAALSRSRRETIENREKLKRHQELQQAVEFSYTPSITNYSSKPTIPLESRFKYEKSRIEEREKQRRILEVEKEAECTFRPTISKRSSTNTVPLYQRVEEVQVEKLRNFTQLKRKYEVELSFKPKINEMSRNLSTQRKNSLDSSTKSMSRTGSVKQISTVSRDLSPFKLPSRDYYEPSEFLMRQAQFSEKLEESRRIKQEEQKKEFNFKPVVNRNSSILVETSASPKTFLQKVRKLSEGNLEKVKKVEMIRENFYAQFRHSPDINQNSKKIGRTSSIEKLTQTNKEKMNQKRREEVQMQDVKNCTFSPDLAGNRQFKYVQSSYRQGADIMKNIQKSNLDKSNRSKELKQFKDFEELKNCSFRPELNEKCLKTGSLKTVRGIERYFELKDIAKRMTRDKYERELKVFCQRPHENHTARN